MGVRLRAALAGIIAGILFVAVDMSDFLITNRKPVGYYDLEISEITDGVYVEDEIFLAMDSVGTEVTTTNTTEKESAWEYALPIIVLYGDDLYIDKVMGLKVFKEDDRRQLEQIVEDTADWWFDETGTLDIGDKAYPITGKIRKMTKDEKDLMLEYASEVFGVSRADAEEYVLPYVLEPISRKKVLIFMAVGVALFVVGIALLVWEILSKKKKPDPNEDWKRFQQSFDAGS